MTHILVLHGPNLDRLGTREPEVYGTGTLADIDAKLQALATKLGVTLTTFQTNHEGALIDAIHAQSSDGIIINPAGLTHTSVALRDALLANATPFIEVHLTNPKGREPFRKVSLFEDVARGVVSGFGAQSYELALRGLVTMLGQHSA